MYSENKELMYKYTGCDQVLYQAFRCFTARKLKRSWDREQLNGQISNYVQVARMYILPNFPPECGRKFHENWLRNGKFSIKFNFLSFLAHF